LQEPTNPRLPKKNAKTALLVHIVCLVLSLQPSVPQGHIAWKTQKLAPILFVHEELQAMPRILSRLLLAQPANLGIIALLKASLPPQDCALLGTFAAARVDLPRLMTALRPHEMRHTFSVIKAIHAYQHRM